MAEHPARRRLAAILAADVVGYSSLMEANEERTLAALRHHRHAFFDPTIAKHGGRIFKEMGDGFLVEFASVLSAVRCAVEIQAGMALRNQDLPGDRRIIFRIGVNLGDVIIEGDDLHGDGVNVATRLEGLAEPGGICLSATVHEQVKRRMEAVFDDLGPRTLKNIAEPLQVFRVRMAPGELAALALPDQPSIAVLPFVNMSTDPEYEFFVDGLTEDLITDLSRNTGLFVIARNSSFAYKGKPTDARRIARELGVRYLLEGSARRAGGRVRINVQLIDSIGGGHLWAERFDREIEDIFDLQDAVTARIATELVGRLVAAPARRRTISIEAYDLCVRGRILVSNGPGNPVTQNEGAMALDRALALDPTYAEPHRWIAFSHLSRWVHSMEPESLHRALAVEHSRAAVALDPNDAGNHWVRAYVLSYEHLVPEFERAFATALDLDPNNADAWIAFADICAVQGKAVAALDAMERAIRFEPHPPGFYYWIQGFVLYCDRQYEAAISTLRRTEVYGGVGHRTLAAALAQLGETDEAVREGALFRAKTPEFRIGRWLAMHAYGDATTLAHFADGCRKAGLPE